MEYNGHKNWNHWNVSLWLFNDEGLYSMMRHAVNACSTRDKAARQILELITTQAKYGYFHNIETGVPYTPFREDGSCYEVRERLPKTPDGAPYTFTSIRAALVDWDQ